MWTRLATKIPANIELRLKLLDLALDNANKDDIKEKTKQSKRTSSRSRRSKGMRGYWAVTVK